MALLLVLLLVAGVTVWEGLLVRGWLRPLEVSIYPINGDGSALTEAYIIRLSVQQFDAIGDFLQQQAKRYRLQPLPDVKIRLEPEIKAPPPQTNNGAHSALSSITWSLRLRYYAFRHTPFWSNLGRIRLFEIGRAHV